MLCHEQIHLNHSLPQYCVGDVSFLGIISRSTQCLSGPLWYVNFDDLVKVFLISLLIFSFTTNKIHFKGIKYPDPHQNFPLDLVSIMITGASLVAQWLGIRLPMQGTRVRAPLREDPTCRRAARLVSHNY